jgi:hypothetical protein
MAKITLSAQFEIKESRRHGLERCEFDVLLISGEIQVHEVFQVEERGTLWEWVILKTSNKQSLTNLFCMNWLPSDGTFVGLKVHSRPMKAPERKRYSKHLTNA